MTSKDGAKVPMFVHKKGIALDGNNPTLMYGYGGFNIATTPGFNSCASRCSSRASCMPASTCAAAASTEAWHDAGTKLKKQNVLDDFIAGAEWLIAPTATPIRRSWPRREARTAACWWAR